MRIYLGGHLSFYHPQKGKWLEIDLDQPKLLIEILADADIPLGEVHLVAMAGETVELDNLMVSDQDEVKLYSAVGGG